jgi:hypothetical protein
LVYDHRATSGNKLNWPVGLGAAKTIMVGKMPLKLEMYVEYSVASQNAYGQRAAIRFLVTPVIPSLIENPIFGGD